MFGDADPRPPPSVDPNIGRGSASGMACAGRIARERVEARYLDGHSALFPATIRDWAKQYKRIETLAGLAARLAELDGLDASPPEDPQAVAVRVDQIVDDLVQLARVKALDEMGEGRKAISIAIRCMQPQLG